MIDLNLRNWLISCLTIHQEKCADFLRVSVLHSFRLYMFPQRTITLLYHQMNFEMHCQWDIYFPQREFQIPVTDVENILISLMLWTVKKGFGYSSSQWSQRFKLWSVHFSWSSSNYLQTCPPGTKWWSTRVESRLESLRILGGSTRCIVWYLHFYCWRIFTEQSKSSNYFWCSKKIKEREIQRNSSS